MYTHVHMNGRVSVLYFLQVYEIFILQVYSALKMCLERLSIHVVTVYVCHNIRYT